MPATRYPIPAQLPPLRQQVHASASVAPAAACGNGSLNRSKMTALLPVKARATEVQNGMAWAASGIGF